MKGSLTVITGCMFSGKTTRVITLAQKALAIGKKIEIYYPEIDTRYTKNYITSHDMIQLPSAPLSIDTVHIEHRVFDTVFIDEIHFFKESMVDAIKKLLDGGIDVVVSGLDKDFRGEGFGIVPQLLHMADEIIELQAKCVVCQKSAAYSQRTSKNDKTIVIGGSDIYEPRCSEHFIKSA